MPVKREVEWPLLTEEMERNMPPHVQDVPENNDVDYSRMFNAGKPSFATITAEGIRINNKVFWNYKFKTWIGMEVSYVHVDKNTIHVYLYDIDGAGRGIFICTAIRRKYLKQFTLKNSTPYNPTPKPIERDSSVGLVNSIISGTLPIESVDLKINGYDIHIRKSNEGSK